MRRLLVAKFSGDLDLSNRDLQAFPRKLSVMPLDSVKRLFLDHNILTSLPSLIIKMTNLEVLRAQHNQLGNITSVTSGNKLQRILTMFWNFPSYQQ